MSILLAYATKHGSTKEIADILSEKISSDIVKINLKNTPKPDISSYDVLIIGAPVYAGRIPKVVRNFIENYHKLLVEKKIFLYLSGMTPQDQLPENLFDLCYGEDIVSYAKSKAHLGGKFDFSKMNFFEKKIIQKVSGVKADVDSIHRDVIENFAQEIIEKLN